MNFTEIILAQQMLECYLVSYSFRTEGTRKPPGKTAQYFKPENDSNFQKRLVNCTEVNSDIEYKTTDYIAAFWPIM